MSITPATAFDICHDVYKALRGNLEGIPLIDPTKTASDHVWRPEGGPRAQEYIADFSLACQAALQGGENASRLVLCRLYYLSLGNYERTRHFLGLREDTWVNWTDEIRERSGKELMRRGIFPVKNYFGERTRPMRKKRLDEARLLT